MEEQKLRELQIESEEIFSGVILDVKRDSVRLPNGHQTVRELIRHVGAVCVVPVTDDGRVVVERQYRYPIDQVITEIPAGKLDSKEEDRLHAAQRELREETGYVSEDWDLLLRVPSQATMGDNWAYVYRARSCRPAGGQHLDETEFLNVLALSPEALEARIRSGEFEQAVHVMAWALDRISNK